MLTVDTTGDTKPQYQEFTSRLIELLGAVDTGDRIIDPDIFQQTEESKDPIHFLRQQKLILDDPFTELL